MESTLQYLIPVRTRPLFLTKPKLERNMRELIKISKSNCPPHKAHNTSENQHSVDMKAQKNFSNDQHVVFSSPPKNTKQEDKKY